MEIEAKLALTSPISPDDVEALDWTPYQLGERHDVQQRDIFFDTADLALTGTRHAVRLREAGTTLVVTLKGPGTVEEGVHAREELEVPTQEREPAQWPVAIRTRLDELIGTQRMMPLLEVHNHRRTWQLVRDEAVIGEVALDEGTIVARGRSEEMHELEIELKGGTREDLARLSALVQRQLPAHPEERTKFARGLALMDDARSAPSP